LYTRELPDGRVIDVIWLTYGRARIILSPSMDSASTTDGW
jgi:hypothetical protein